jgi:hypothetical protein
MAIVHIPAKRAATETIKECLFEAGNVMIMKSKTAPIASSNAADAHPPVPEEVVRAAMAEPALKGRVFLCSKRREPLMFDAMETSIGWRHGPIFVLHGFRGKKLVQQYYASHPERLCVAFIPDGNTASRRMHTQAGFKYWRRHGKGTFMRREAIVGGSDGK